MQLTDAELSRTIRGGVLSVCAPNGPVVLPDARYSKPFNSNYCGLSMKRIKDSFQAPAQCDRIGRCNGSVLLPLGRRIAKYLPAFYFPVKYRAPFFAATNPLFYGSVS